MNQHEQRQLMGAAVALKGPRKATQPRFPATGTLTTAARLLFETRPADNSGDLGDGNTWRNPNAD